MGGGHKSYLRPQENEWYLEFNQSDLLHSRYADCQRPKSHQLWWTIWQMWAPAPAWPCYMLTLSLGSTKSLKVNIFPCSCRWKCHLLDPKVHCISITALLFEKDVPTPKFHWFFLPLLFPVPHLKLFQRPDLKRECSEKEGQETLAVWAELFSDFFGSSIMPLNIQFNC